MNATADYNEANKSYQLSFGFSDAESAKELPVRAEGLKLAQLFNTPAESNDIQKGQVQRALAIYDFSVEKMAIAGLTVDRPFQGSQCLAHRLLTK